MIEFQDKRKFQVDIIICSSFLAQIVIKYKCESTFKLFIVHVSTCKYMYTRTPQQRLNTITKESVYV